MARLRSSFSPLSMTAVAATTTTASAIAPGIPKELKVINVLFDPKHFPFDIIRARDTTQTPGAMPLLHGAFKALLRRRMAEMNIKRGSVIISSTIHFYTVSPSEEFVSPLVV